MSEQERYELIRMLVHVGVPNDKVSRIMKIIDE